MTPNESSVTHMGGNFYQAQNAKGDFFFGNKEKAEGFAKGTYTPTYRVAVEDMQDIPVVEDEDEAA